MPEQLQRELKVRAEERERWLAVGRRNGLGEVFTLLLELDLKEQNPQKVELLDWLIGEIERRMRDG